MPLLSSDEVKPIEVKSDSVGLATRKKIVYVNASSGTTIVAGAYEIITIQPPAGKIWRIVAARIIATALSGATTGTHYFYINYSLSSSTTDMLLLASTYSSAIDVRTAPISYNTIEPNDVMTWTYILKTTKFSYANPCYVNYRNLTDADQTSPRTIKLIVEEEDEAT